MISEIRPELLCIWPSIFGRVVASASQVEMVVVVPGKDVKVVMPDILVARGLVVLPR